MNKGNRYSQIQNGIVNSIINDKTFINTKFGIITFSDTALVGDRNYIDNPKDWTINYQIVDGTAGNDLVHSSSTLKDYVTYPNYDMVNEAKLKIKEVLK